MLNSFDGIRVIPDIHGEYSKFEKLVEYGRQKNYFILQIGDPNDYGPESLKCLELVSYLVKHRLGAQVRGNHDEKLYRYLQGKEVKIRHGLQATLDEVNRHPRGQEILDEFKHYYQYARYWLRWKNYVFIHGAFHPDMLIYDGPDHPMIDKRHASFLKQRAIYGETTGRKINNYPERIYNWVDTIPMGIQVVVGHDIRSKEGVTCHMGQQFGTAHFIDTGCGKGGPLSFMDIPKDGKPSIKTMTEDTSLI